MWNLIIETRNLEKDQTKYRISWLLNLFLWLNFYIFKPYYNYSNFKPNCKIKVSTVNKTIAT